MSIQPFRYRSQPMLAAVCLAALALSACSDKAAEPAASAAAVPVASAPAAPVAAPPPPSAEVSQAAPAAAPATTAARQIPLQVQGTARLGLTVRVKSVELGEDATVLTISASYASRAASYTKLAAVDTYLKDPAGNRMMLKRPPENPDLKIVDGDTMEGKLVFLGSVPPGTTELTLVLNDGSESDNSIGPGLSIKLPLVAAGGTGT